VTAVTPAPLAPRAGALAPPLRRVLDRIGANGEPLALDELARRLFALTAPPAPGLARRLVASALGFGAGALPEPLDVRALPRLAAGDAAGIALADAEWIVVDLETTGLSLEACTILEIGAVRVAGGRLADRFQTLVDPGAPIPPRISALTGIDRTLVDGAPPLRRAIRAFHAWAGAGSATAFVAHNAGFDERFVRRALAEHALPDWTGPVVCTCKLARRLVPALPRYDLDGLCAHFGVTNRARHRALGDAEAAARALVELLAIAQGERALTTLGDLLVLQAAPAARRKRRRKPGAAPAAAPEGPT
jgi:DNA polymerase III epsilon subunit family exonuclease